MLLHEQFGVIQNFQTSPVLQTSFLVRTFFSTSSSKTALAQESTNYTFEAQELIFNIMTGLSTDYFLS